MKNVPITSYKFANHAFRIPKVILNTASIHTYLVAVMNLIGTRRLFSNSVQGTSNGSTPQEFRDTMRGRFHMEHDSKRINKTT